MHEGKCKCFHHVCVKVLVLLAWLSAVGFWLALWKGVFWNVGSTVWFSHVVVFILLAFSTKVCGCCWKAKMMSGGHGMSCSACEGKGGEHTHGM